MTLCVYKLRQDHFQLDEQRFLRAVVKHTSRGSKGQLPGDGTSDGKSQACGAGQKLHGLVPSCRPVWPLEAAVQPRRGDSQPLERLGLVVLSTVVSARPKLEQGPLGTVLT